MQANKTILFFSGQLKFCLDVEESIYEELGCSRGARRQYWSLCRNPVLTVPAGKTPWDICPKVEGDKNGGLGAFCSRPEWQGMKGCANQMSGRSRASVTFPVHPQYF